MTEHCAPTAGPGDPGWLDSALVAEIRDDLLDHPGPVTDSAVAAAVRRSGRVLGSAAMLELVARLSAQLAGAGPLQPLLDRPGVTDVFVNGPRDVWADSGEGLEQVSLSLGSESDVRALAVRLAASGGRRLDDSSPLVDVRMPDGVRVNAVIPPLSGDVTVLSFRIPRPRASRSRTSSPTDSSPEHSSPSSRRPSRGGRTSWSPAGRAPARRCCWAPCSPPRARPTAC